ncbi:DNA-processing protein DprA [Streptomyces sp. BBFR102]|uniref:DNA-processing protein DprA n=1 Tax=Streptomyces sp. BBFR102 TaxID=3448171 RepID=UPI003F53B738
MTSPDEGRLLPAQEQPPRTAGKMEDVSSGRLARAGLTRVLEPGDPRGGQWLRGLGPVALLDRLRGEGPPLPGASAGRMAGLRLRARDAHPELDLATAREAGARFVCPGDAEWPAQLDDLGDARPLGLWVRGTPSLRFWALRSVALVGARACTDYGAHAAGLLGAGLAERGWVVVSGGAYGIDGAAHRAALGAGGATVAVLACGVDSHYPRGHAQLIARIAEQGLLVSELPPGDHPTPSRFVLRNRVIAALTRGTVVVEAAHRSGALSTARAALRLGRAVMGVPGPVTSSLSAGVHELLRGEGHLVTDTGDIVELVGGIGELAPAKSGPVLPRDLLPDRLSRALEAVPAGPGALLERIARAAATGLDETVGDLYELLALGYVEREGEIWKLTRQALSGGFPTCDDPLAKVPGCPDHAP